MYDFKSSIIEMSRIIDSFLFVDKYYSALKRIFKDLYRNQLVLMTFI